MEGLRFLYAYLDEMVRVAWKDHMDAGMEEWGSDTYWHTLGSWATYREIRDLIAEELGEGVRPTGYSESFKIGHKLRALENIYGMLDELTPEQRERFERALQERALQGAVEEGEPSWLYHRHDPELEDEEEKS